MNSKDTLNMTVALFLGDLAVGGAERVFVTLSKYLIKRGHRVELILAHKSGELLGELDPAVKVIDLNVCRGGEPGWGFGFRTLFKLVMYLRSHPPQVLLSTLTGANLTCLVARRISGRRFRLVIREAVTHDNVRSPVRKLLMRWFYPSADHVIALTEHMRDEMITVLQLPTRKLTVIGNPLDSERIDVLARDERELSEINSHVPYIIAIGRLCEQKDFATLIRAVNQLPATAPNLVIIGEGPLRAELEAHIKRYNLCEKVHLLGFRANPYPWLQAAQGFVLSSQWEGYPNALFEAIYFGLPVVVSEYDRSIRSLLSPLPSNRYRIVPVGDADALAKALLDLLIMNIQRGQKSQDGRVNLIRDVVDQYEKVLEIKNNDGDV